MELSVIIPAYNEEKRIRKTLETLIAYLDRKKHNYEIIVVNDGSTDKTKEVIQEYVKDSGNKNPNRPKGRGIREIFNVGNTFDAKKRSKNT